MITTQKIVKLFFNTLASLVCLMSTYVFALELPSSARLVLSDTTDIKNINDDNPFGLNTDDPHSIDDVLIDVLK